MNPLFQATLALAAGAGMALQAAINSRLAAGMGGQPLLAALASFAIGTLCLLAVALPVADWPAAALQVARQPWWRWLGGALGAVFVFTSVFLAPRLGVTNVMFLFIVGQLLAGMTVDSFGLMEMPVRPVTWFRLAGLGLMLAGLGLFMFGGRWFSAGGTQPGAPAQASAPRAP